MPSNVRWGGAYLTVGITAILAAVFFLKPWIGGSSQEEKSELRAQLGAIRQQRESQLEVFLDELGLPTKQRERLKDPKILKALHQFLDQAIEQSTAKEVKRARAK